MKTQLNTKYLQFKLFTAAVWLTMTNIELPVTIRDSINAVITSEYITSPSIKFKTDSGNGYLAQVYEVTVKGSNKSIDLFIKHLPCERDLYDKIFRNELRFYEEIYPAMVKFQKECHVEDIFNNIPRSYCTKIDCQSTPPIILENLKTSGYTLSTKIDDEHIILVMKTYAKYHATSFCMKAQKSDLFMKFCTNTDFMNVFFKEVMDMRKMMHLYIDIFVENLHPVHDRILVSTCRNLADVLADHFTSTPSFIDDYACFGHGDTRSNNIMFLYDQNSGNPIDVKLIDWQMHKFNIPTLDLAYFLYTSVTKETLPNINNYLKLYYDALYDHIKKLGNDPEQLYPYGIFMDHWTKSRMLGLTLAFIVIRVQLVDVENAPDIINNQDKDPPLFKLSNENQSKYQAIMKDILQHFIDIKVV